MHPPCRHIVHVETYLNVDCSSSAQIKIQFRTFLKRIQIFGFPCCSTCEDLSIDVSITNVGLILTKPGCFVFLSGYGQTDGRQGFGILTWKHVGTQKILLKAQNEELAVDRIMHPWMTGNSYHLMAVGFSPSDGSWILTI